MVSDAHSPTNEASNLKALYNALGLDLLGSVHKSSESEDTDIFSSNLTPSGAPNGQATRVRVSVSVAKAAEFQAIVDDGSGTTVTKQYNDGDRLTANAENTFDLYLDAGNGWEVNFQISNVNGDTSANVTLVVLEVPGG